MYKKIALTTLLVSICAVSSLPAENISFTGTVLDTNQNPVPNANIRLLDLKVEPRQQKFEIADGKNTKTDDSGNFTFTSEKAENPADHRFGIIIARKDNYSIDWANWHFRKDQTEKFTLGQPKSIAGQITDLNSLPVPNAEVRIIITIIKTPSMQRPKYLTSIKPIDIFLTKTDPNGKFRFDNLPENAMAELAVSKPGYANLTTFKQQNMPNSQLSFKAGNTDISIELPPPASIKGTLTDKQTGKPIPNRKIMLFSDGFPWHFNGQAAEITAPDGSFKFDNLTPGQWTIKQLPLQSQPDKYIIEEKTITLETGQTLEDVNVLASTGGFIEVTVREDQTSKPVERASVQAFDSNKNVHVAAQTDANGFAKLTVPPGTYRISIYANTYRKNMQHDNITVEQGKTTKDQFLLEPIPTTSGTVTDPNGNPLENVEVRVLPGGRVSETTNPQGKFEISWQLQDWHQGEAYLCCRYEPDNLAAVVQIYEDTTQQNLKLEPAITFIGKVTDQNDVPIENAVVRLNLQGQRWGSLYSREHTTTGPDGKFAYKAIAPDAKYNVNITADGFGNANFDDIETHDLDQPQIDVGTAVLPLANMSIAGIVLDVNNNPLNKVNVSASGNQQPHKYMTTGPDGKFRLEGLCEGTVRLHFSGQVNGNHCWGNIQVIAGDEQIEYILTKDSNRSKRRLEYEKIDEKKLPSLKQFSLEQFETAAADKPILLAFIDLNQRPGRHALKTLTEKYQTITQKGIAMAVIQTAPPTQSLEKWKAKQKFPFPIGKFPEEPKKIRKEWGIKALPWLIITDKNHKIIKTGFQTDQIDQIIPK